MDKDTLGRWGEKQAAKFLKRQGLRILVKNARSTVGEIDLVAREGGELVFVEVKTRTSGGFGGPLRAVNPAKRRKLVQLARTFLAQNHLGDDTPCRFDIVGITLAEDGKTPEIEYVPDAFDAFGRLS
jgi:putative endonuclease